jgi:tRNA (cmo5U34)-methyltransferase
VSSQKDSIYANPLGKITEFTFDETVAQVFPDMIARSVPGYRTIIEAIGLLSKEYAQANSNCYDLGCSLGAASLCMSAHIEADNCRIIAIDNSEPMICAFSQTLSSLTLPVPIDLICADILDVVIENASVVVLNFTLQFVPVAYRTLLLRRIYDGLNPGGLLILSEKLHFTDPQQNALQIKMHHVFKMANGYSAIEISQKRSALENVLIPETFAHHQDRLLNVGFTSAEIWFQYFNFASMIALK